MNLKEARKARHEAFTGLEQAQKRLREAEAALEEAKVRAGQQAANDRFLASLNKTEKKRYHANVALADRLLERWTRDETHEWYTCLRKNLHMTEAAGWAAAAHDKGMHPYLCVWCVGWHIGHGSWNEGPLNEYRVKAKLLESIHKEFPFREVKR